MTSQLAAGLEAFVTCWPRRASAEVATRLYPEKLESVLDALAPALDQRRSVGSDLNVWRVSGVGRSEVRNTAVLAWLMSPGETHGLETRVLSEIVSALMGSAAGDLDLTRALVVAEETPMGDLEDRIDISVELPNHLLFIEAKIDAPFSPSQLDRYRQRLARKCGLVGASSTLATLTLQRMGLADTPGLTWRQVAQLLRQVSLAGPPGLGAAIVGQYADHIEGFYR